MTGWLTKQYSKREGTAVGAILFAAVLVFAWFIRRRELDDARRKADKAAEKQARAFIAYAEEKRAADLAASVHDRRARKRYAKAVARVTNEFASAKAVADSAERKVESLRGQSLTDYANELLKAGAL